MNKPAKLTITAAIAVLLSGGAAAAATGNLPAQAGDGLSNAGDHTGISLPASQESHPTADDHPGGTSSDDVETTDSSSEHPDNHGADVSAVAQSTDTTGQAHGEAVSAVARDNTGQNDHAASQANDASANGQDHQP